MRQGRCALAAVVIECVSSVHRRPSLTAFLQHVWMFVPYLCLLLEHYDFHNLFNIALWLHGVEMPSTFRSISQAIIRDVRIANQPHWKHRTRKKTPSKHSLWNQELLGIHESMFDREVQVSMGVRTPHALSWERDLQSTKSTSVLFKEFQSCHSLYVCSRLTQPKPNSTRLSTSISL